MTDSLIAVACACGPDHTVILDDAGRVFVSGRGSYGRLGLNDETDRHSLTQIESTLRIFNLEGKAVGDEAYNGVMDWPIKGSRIVGVAAGGLGSAFMDDRQRLYVCGWGGHGRLGLGDTTLQETLTESKALSRCLCPARVLFVLSAPQSRWSSLNSVFKKVLEDFYCVAFKSCAIGRTHMLLIDEDGFCYSTGLNAQGQLGQGSRDDCNIPRRVSGIDKITAVACGVSHSLFLHESGKVYGSGRGVEGQLGVSPSLSSSSTSPPASSSNSAQSDEGGGACESVEVPTAITSLANKWISHIAAGSHHSLLLDATGRVYAFGSNVHGQLGTGTNLNSYTPTQISLPPPPQRQSQPPQSQSRSSATSSGAKGRSSARDTSEPFQKVVAIAAGDTHSLFLTEYGTVYAAGNGEHGQLGVGDDTEDLLKRFSSAMGLSSQQQQGDTQTSTEATISLSSVHGSAITRDCDRHSPTQMRIPSNVFIVAVSAGQHHSVLIDRQGGVWVCGTGHFGELCCGELCFFAVPTLVPNTGANPVSFEELRTAEGQKAKQVTLRDTSPESASTTKAKPSHKGLFDDGLKSAVFDEDLLVHRSKTSQKPRTNTTRETSNSVSAAHEALAVPLATDDATPLANSSEEQAPAKVIEVAPNNTADSNQQQPDETSGGTVHVMDDGSLVHAFTSLTNTRTVDDDDNDALQTNNVPTKPPPEHPLEG